MVYRTRYFFFRCINCGEWYYTTKIIKRKKCVKCHKSFSFEKASKFFQKCSTKEAILLIQHLKLKDKELINFH